MIRFGHTSKGPLADARAAAQWLGTLPVNDPLAVAQQVTALLGTVAERSAKRTPAALAAAFIVDMHTSGVVRKLTAQYALHASRSPKIEDQIWRALLDLAQAYEACYAAFAREIPEGVQHPKWQVLLPELIARQIVHLGREAKIRLYRCERWIPAKWAELHGTFARACGQGVERHPLLLDPATGATTIEHQYLVTLVLQLIDPGDLKPRQIDWVAGHLEDWCRSLRLTLQARSPSTFYVNLGGTAGLRRRTPGALEGHVLFVDTQPLHAQLVQNRVTLEQALKGSPASARTHEQRQQLELFIKLANRLDPEFRPLARRGERRPASGPIDAIVGFASIAGFLNVDERPSSAPRTPDRSFGSTMEVAVFGRSRDVPDRRDDLLRQRIAAFAPAGGPWELKDVSASGYRLHAPMTVATEVTLSMLVAVHRDGRDGWELGIVRRMRRLSALHAEIGLQLIANAVSRAELVLLPPEREPAEGGEERTAAPGRRFQGLLLSYEKDPGEPPVHSLLVPPIEYRPTRRYSLTTPTATRAVRFGRLLEQQPDWIWTVMEAATAGTHAADAGSSA